MDRRANPLDTCVVAAVCVLTDLATCALATPAFRTRHNTDKSGCVVCDDPPNTLDPPKLITMVLAPALLLLSVPMSTSNPPLSPSTFPFTVTWDAAMTEPVVCV